MSSQSPGKLITPFWNQNSISQGKYLWLPTQNTINSIHKNNYNSSLKRLSDNSWFTMNQFNNSNKPEYKCNQFDDINKNNVDNKFKTKKIKLLPTLEQRIILNNWFNTARWVYNKSLESINNKELSIDRVELRQKWLNGANIKNNYQWSENTPSAIRDGVIDDLLIAFKTNFVKGEKFKMKFRSKKSPSQSIVIPKKDYKRANVFFPKSLGKFGIKSAETLPQNLDFDCRLQRTKLGEFFLCLLSNIEPKGDNQAPKAKNIISLDPGVRTFMTAYDPQGSIYEWGKNDINRLFRLGCCADKIKSLIDSKVIIHKTRYRLRRVYLRIFKKIKNLVDTLHKNLSKWLCENYHNILIPEFKAGGMVRRKERKIKSKTVRNMLTWSHYSFRQRLISKAREYPWCNVILTTEEYTSKTCGNCGIVKENLGGNKMFNCSYCKIKIDRDFNGARNILLKFLSNIKIKPKLVLVPERVISQVPLVLHGNILP
jgi:putative transposase